MDSKIAPRPAGHEGGFVLVAVMALVTVLLGTGLAFMHWSADEATQSAEATAAMQAFYLGQMGIVEQGFAYLRALPASQLPIAETVLPGRRVGDYGNYDDVRISFLQAEGQEGDFWSQERRYRISAVGTVRIPFYNEGHSDYKDVKRKAVLYVQVRNFADYMYLSNEEMTRLNDRIKFWNGDTLNGRVHSNSEIAIMQSPVFYELVSTTEDDFWRGAGYSPVFLGPDPLFNADPVEIPAVAENLRAGAAAQGNFYTMPGQQWRAHFTNGSITLYHWDIGTPFDSTSAAFQVVPVSNSTCVFVDGPLEVYGLVQGRVTIGSSQNMRLIDNIRYVDANPVNGRTPEDSHNFLGLVSEGDIKVANTIANGRNNSSGLGNSQTNPNLTSIVITAAVVALGESFSFEQQNDLDSGYVFCTPPQGGPDDRGQIFIFGSLTQMRRGYVHRSTCQSSGYLKTYRYDQRFLQTRPPCFFDAKDEHGRALFDIVQWGQGVESAPDRALWKLNRYN